MNEIRQAAHLYHIYTTEEWKKREINQADFKKWKYQALTMRDECTGGKISVEEYTQWMEDYFPNRKSKQDKPIFAQING